MGTQDRGKELLAAIYANPADIEARQVYADYLQEQGDPRGELIILQSQPKSPEREAREAELIEKHAEDWHGKLSKVTTWVEYEYGFLARCGMNSYPEWVIGRREWATVKHISCSEGWQRDLAELITHPVMKSLESLRIELRALEHMLGSTKPSGVKKLVLDGSFGSWESDTSPKQLLASKIFENLTELEVRGAAPLLELLDTKLERLSLEHAGWAITCRRGTDGKLSVMSVSQKKQKWGRSSEISSLVKLLLSLPKDALSKFEMKPLTVDVKKALARQTRI